MHQSTPIPFNGLTSRNGQGFADALQAILERKRRRKLFDLYPETGPLRRELYPKHMEFFAVGKTHRERCAMCANRVGKTYGMGGYELACHLTGWYPHWWVGRRFTRPISAWAAGDSNETTRDIIQLKLLGEVTMRKNRKMMDGTGIIPGEWLGEPSWRSGVSDLVDTIPVLHQPTGRWSELGLKSYAQGRRSFEGTEKDVILLDEEPPMGVYNECVLRTAGTTGTYESNGIIMLTFTPLLGVSEVVRQFVPNSEHDDNAKAA